MLAAVEKDARSRDIEGQLVLGEMASKIQRLAKRRRIGVSRVLAGAPTGRPKGLQQSLRDAAAGIRVIYEDMLNRAWRDARDRGNKLPPESQKAIPPTVPGQQ